jgi:molecular chaperone GrpE
LPASRQVLAPRGVCDLVNIRIKNMEDKKIKKEEPKKEEKPFDSAQGRPITEVEKIKKELEDAKAKCEEYLNGWKRERADFINYKKNEVEKMGELVKYANEDLILKIIPILDNLYLAANHIKDEGLTQIKKQLEDFLKKEGIEAIETVGKKFDPNTMEAVEGDGDTVAEETQRGYVMSGKIIRVAKVKISK